MDIESKNLVVSIPVVIDADAIQRQATKAAMSEIENRIVRDFFANDYYNGSTASRTVKNSVDKVIRERTDDIIDEAVKLIADKLCRSSKFREKVSQGVNDANSH